MTESQLLAAVLEAAALLGFRCFHPRPARTAGSWRTAAQGNGATGFPDVVMVGNQRVIFAELKTDNGRLRPEQREWLGALQSSGADVETYVWRERDWVSGAILDLLRGRKQKKAA